MPDKDKMYFNDYATLVQQQGMLQDHVRTSIYQFAVYENKEDFKGKRVLDVGAGTGILSFFAAKAGASHVYAVEASGMALKAEKLAAGNGLQDVVTVLNKRVEEVTLDEKVWPVPISDRPRPDPRPKPRPKPEPKPEPKPRPTSRPGRPTHLGAPGHRPRQRAHDRELHRRKGAAAQAGRQDVPRPRGAARRALLRRGALQRADPEGCAPPTHPTLHPTPPSANPTLSPSPSTRHPSPVTRHPSPLTLTPRPSPSIPHPHASRLTLRPSPPAGHFWAARDFYGIDLAPVQEDARNFYFSQPVVGLVPPHTLVADSCRKDFDFNTMSLESIRKYTMKVRY